VGTSGLPKLPFESGEEIATTTVYGSHYATLELPRHEMPENEMPREVAYRMIK
jgi:glutamate decarboxylase